MVNSVLNITCSMAVNKNSPPVDSNLLEELRSNKYQQQQDAVRAVSDPKKQGDLKNKMPVLLPCGIFKGAKDAKNLVKHTGLIAIDIDAKDNLHIRNFDALQIELCKIKYVAYCGKSVRGKGYFLIIPIAYPDKHKLHFKYIESYFKSKGIVIDPTCKNVNRLRYYSYDAQAYYNHAAKLLQAYYKPPVIKATQSQQSRNKAQQSTGNVYSDAMQWVSDKGVQFADGTKHEYIFHLCCYLVYKGVKKSDAENWIDKNKDLMPLSEITSNCIDYPYANYQPGKEVQQSTNKAQSTRQPITPKPQQPQPTVTPDPQPKPIATGTAPEPTSYSYSLQQLEAMAIKHLNNTMLRDKTASKANYMKCWSEGMEQVINAAGFTQQQFLNSIL